MEEKYEKFLVTLRESSKWPSVYLFKFIVPADNDKIARVEALFDSKTAEIKLKTSSKGKFVSVSAKEIMLTPEAVVEKYVEASNIEGLIAL